MTALFSHRHLLGIAQLAPGDITAILNRAAQYAKQNRLPNRNSAELQGKTVVNLFFEASTRTRTSFEIAARRLGADAINVPLEVSSTTKGETLFDTIRTLNAMQVDAFVIRHRDDGAPESLTGLVDGAILNAGDGAHAHPTQALLDALTIQRHKGKLEGLKVVICGDIEHSRVARSNIDLLKKMGAYPSIVAPEAFMPHDFDALGVPATDDMVKGLHEADAIIMLRIQHERLIASERKGLSHETYYAAYGLDHAKMAAAKPDAIVLHPGPLNRGIEISSELADDPNHSVIVEQVEMGVAVRMACLSLLLGKREI